ncbi:MAG TPA: T9SS type A sorting domain-containing protein, partial [Bacteroidales bacterium]|nr:T9SS type A sorting domain-containing protein [Bacteroidales bacterium]
FTFNQGIAGETNSAVTSLTDASASAKNGTLNSFVLSGSTSNWVAGYIPAVLSVSSLTANIGDTEGSTATVNVASNLAWTAVSDQTWLTVSPASATGNGIITLTAIKNPATATRMATITITATGVPVQTITATQKGSTTGIEDNTAGALRLFPNPATDQFRIEGVDAGSTLKLFNLTGKLLISIESYNGTPVQISNLPRGIYFVKVKEKIFRFVKQ